VALSTRDLKGVLAFVSDAHDVDAHVPLTPELLDALAELVGCEYATYQAYDWPRRVVTAHVPCTNEGPFATPPPYVSEGFWDGSCHRYWTRAAFDKWSDRLHRRERERLCVGVEHFDEFRIVDRLSLHVGDPRTRSAWVGFESQRRDFDGRDRELGLALRPHLDALWRGSVARRQVAELLAALERDDGTAADRAIVLFAADGRIDQATAQAQRLLAAWFGTGNGRLPFELHGWAAAARPGDRYTERCDGSILAVVAAGDFMLTLHEQVSGEANLTRREREVLRLVAEGLTNAEIARRLWIAPSTVAKHLEQAYPKLGVHSRTAAIARLAKLSG
jgi:DNA-binding CsgD family transcriptional regulator